MKFWRQHRDDDGSQDTGARRLELTHAQRRLEEVEARVEVARGAILHRHARNHWTETIRRTIGGADA